MPKLSDDAYARRRSNIIAAAKRQFAAHGIHVSVDEICADAGVSKGALYGYFKSKDAIIEALAEDHRLVIEDFETLATMDALKAILLERMNIGDRTSSRLELEAWAYSLRKLELHRLLDANVGHLRAAIAHALETMQRSGAIALAVSPDVGADLLTTFATGVIASAALSNDDRATEQEATLHALLTLIIGQ
jgi:AcrR family transcriptional regulator